MKWKIPIASFVIYLTDCLSVYFFKKEPENEK